jgi:hypothetical protein
MGAEYFSTYQEGTDVATAFTAAVDGAEDGYGRRGYSGSVAEKDEYKIVTRAPMPLDEAEALALDLSEGDLGDKHGPAGAIPVLTDRRSVRVIILQQGERFTGYKDLKEAAVASLTATGELKPGEVPAYGIQGAYYTHPRTRRPVSGELQVPLEGGPLEHRGWLFFGYASY